MKNILESEEVFEAYARIDYNLLLVKKIFDDISKTKNPIEILIDKAISLDKKIIDDLIKVFEEIIADKKFIEADYSAEAGMVQKLQTRSHYE